MSHAHHRPRLRCAPWLATATFASLISNSPVTAVAADLTVDPARIDAITAMLPPRPVGLGRPITDRVAWEALAQRPTFSTVIPNAEKLLNSPIPESSDELFQDFSRTGNRTHWQSVNSVRRGRLNTLALAECLENQGRFLPALSAAIQSTCAERTWVMPAHDSGLGNFKGERIDIDLGAVHVAWTLATIDWLLGDSLSPADRQLIQTRLRERILDPFKDMATRKRSPNGWITAIHNWNAVCLAGVTGTALAVAPTPQERAFFVAAAEQYSRNFLSGFADDGYCSEGVGYWNYGFGHYLLLAETILQATGGRVDLLADERARRAAMYGTKIEIVDGVCPAFADCAVSACPARHYLWYISRRWGLGMRDVENAEPLTSPGSLFETMLFAFPNAASQTQPAAVAWEGRGPRTWFDHAGILIARPGRNADGRLAVALKGGHNAEHHNHNDVGAYVIVVGRQVVLADPGHEVYTARTFSPRRYDSRALNSFGHPVPMVAGKLQRTGKQARGRVVRTDFTDAADTLVLDIASAYDVPAIEKLERTFVYSRGGTGTLTVTDEAAFSSPQEFGTALITFGQWRKLAPDKLRIEDGGEAVDVAIHATGGEYALKTEEIHEDWAAGRTPTRIGINLLQPVSSCTVTLMISPADK